MMLLFYLLISNICHSEKTPGVILHLSLTPLVIYSSDLSIFMELVIITYSVHERDPLAWGSNDTARTASSPVTACHLLAAFQVCSGADYNLL